ncbi:hypothetical protein ABLE91_16740 [Aquabacter sp. CN5-332]|uniref:hypothetical protein n=1 Tax=Aquabacter sp. CN5-332 TaxID=3156608 RepID=UPI0032B52D6B
MSKQDAVHYLMAFVPGLLTLARAARLETSAYLLAMLLEDLSAEAGARDEPDRRAE